MLRELLFLGRALEESGLEAHVLQATGRLYLLDLHPKAKEARLVPYELGPEQCRRFLWVGDPPASNAPRDRATTKKLAYLLGQVPTRLAEDPGLKPLLQGLLFDPGRPGGKARFLLDLRGYRLLGAKDAEAPPFRVRGERLEAAEDLGERKAGDLAEALAEVLEKAWGVAPPGKGEEVLFSLALEGRPLADFPEYRDYLKRLLTGERRFARGSLGLCHACGRAGVPVAQSFADFKLKFYITDKKGFAPGVREEGFAKAYALCRDCFRALRLGERFALENLKLRFLETEALVLPGAELEPGRLSRLVERLLAQVKGLERLSAWRDFLARAKRQEGVGYLGFTLLLFREAQAATKAEEVVLEVPPSRVEALFRAMEEV
ncbi:MAG: TM1802 family CRISPR-associated protein, partial [Thermus sp.]|uniref:TM1802 family CRISPR-associated protein n=1 Tax=Thermus sp. TaxID=275 RepID=UPI003D0EFFD5